MFVWDVLGGRFIVLHSDPLTTGTSKIHSDTCGPMQVQAVGGNKYLVTFIHDATRFIHWFLVPNKRAQTVLEAFIILQNLVETEAGCKILAIRTDNGTEYKGAFDAHLKQHGIQHQVMIQYSP